MRRRRRAPRDWRRVASSHAAAAALGVLLWTPAGAARFTLPATGAPPGGTATAPVEVDDASGMLGIDLVLSYDPAVVEVTSVALTPLSASQTLTYNLSPPGTVWISLYGTTPLNGGGPLVEIAFESVGAASSSTDLNLLAEVNESAIPASVLDGVYCVDAPPGEAANLTLTLPTAGPVAHLAWDPQPVALSYHLYQATLADLTDLACLASVPTAEADDDGAAPPPGGLLLYLVTVRGCGGESSLGFSSAGVERINAVPCP